MKNVLNIIIVLALIAGAIWVKGKFFPNEVTKIKTIEKIDTVYQDSLVYEKLPAPDPDTIYVVDKDTIKLPSDTVIAERYINLFQKYHSRYIYNDTLKNDTSAFIAVHDIVSKNKITHRELYYHNRTPTMIYNKTTVYNQRKLFVGTELGTQTIQPTIEYKDLNDITYSIGYDFTGPERGLRFGIKTSISGIFN